MTRSPKKLLFLIYQACWISGKRDERIIVYFVFKFLFTHCILRVDIVEMFSLITMSIVFSLYYFGVRNTIFFIIMCDINI